MTVTSGCRCPAYNQQLKERGYPASDTSLHMWGRAADLECHDPLQVYDAMCKRFHDGGIFLYDWGVHVDTRTNGPARGDYRGD